MHVERLQRMVKLLRDDAAKPDGVKFDLSSWAAPVNPEHGARDTYVLTGDVKVAEGERYYSELKPPVVVPVSCDTFACALGLAAISGEFEKDGLSYSIMAAGYGFGDTIHAGDTGSLMPAFKGGLCRATSYGFEAGMALFGISYDDSRYFFDPECYDVTPKEAVGELYVAQRIEDFVNGEIDRDFHPGFLDDEDENDDE